MNSSGTNLILPLEQLRGQVAEILSSISLWDSPSQGDQGFLGQPVSLAQGESLCPILIQIADELGNFSGLDRPLPPTPGKLIPR